MMAHGPRNFEYGQQANVNQKYLERCASAFPESVSIRFFLTLSNNVLVEDVKGCDSIPPIRRLFFGGISAARRGLLNNALQYLKDFLVLQEADSSNPLSPFAIEEARKTLVDVYRIKGRIQEMQSVIVESYINRAHSVRRLPVRRVYETCKEAIDEASRYIEFPIIAYLACDDPHEVCLGLKAFLRNMRVDKPSELVSNSTLPKISLAVLFLRACAPEVIDSLQSLNTVDKVEAERLLLLDWVIKKALTYARLAETELLRITQHAQLREALQKIEGARVVLNLSALREAEQEHFSDAFFRYAAQKELAAQSQDEFVNAFQVLRRSGGVIIIPTKDIIERKGAALKAFTFGFREVRDAFIFSPQFGIEACLSGRIRHGILIQHIRKPFVERRLAVRRDSPERKDIENYWATRLLPFGDNEVKIESIMEVLFTLTERIDAIAETVKGSWIQSKTETRSPDGLFDYNFTDEELFVFHKARIQDVKTVDIFLDRVFDLLLERTRASLHKVRESIGKVLCKELATIVDDAILQLTRISGAIDFLELRNSLVQCLQEIEPTCYQMIRWFQESDASLIGDAYFDLIVKTAIGMIERLNPDIRGHHENIKYMGAILPH